MTNFSSWADTAQAVKYNVHLGTWVNYSRGRIMGATLTLNKMSGNLLIAFTATFVGIVTAALWRIGCLLFHRIHSTPEPRDTLHHQRQALLRNSPSPEFGLWMFSQLAWTWRRNTRDFLARTLPALIFAALCLCAFTIAGGFSSSISSSAGNEVLLDGSNCSIVFTGANAKGTMSLSNFVTQTINNAANYALECYSSNGTGLFDCNTFVEDHLPGMVDDEAGCPFPGNICRSNNSNIFFDSGYIDSRESFGWNTPDSERLFFRTTLHCAPLETTGFARNVSTVLNNYTEYYYGPTVLKETNFTWKVEDLDAQYLRQLDNEMAVATADLQLGVLFAEIVNSTVWVEASEFNPDLRLFRPDADLYLIFLSGNGVYFNGPSYDPWYRGYAPGVEFRQIYLEGEYDYTAYRPLEAASPLGCIQQYQYCNADRQCGNLASFTDAMATAAMFFNTSQEMIWGSTNANISGLASSRFNWFEKIMYTVIDLRSMLKDLGSASLTSRQYFDAGHLSYVPDNQWKLDVTHWWSTLMAARQAAFVNAAHGPTDQAILEYSAAPENSYMEDICNNQKILSTNYTSFSLFGLYFTFVTGLLAIIISYSLEPIFGYFYRHGDYSGYKYLEWTTNQTLQLQRLAYQGLGSGAWSGYTDTIPRTRNAYFLADLPLSYPVEDEKSVGVQIEIPNHLRDSSVTGQFSSTEDSQHTVANSSPEAHTQSAESTANDTEEIISPVSSSPASSSPQAFPPRRVSSVPVNINMMPTFTWLSFGVLQLPTLQLGAPYATQADPTGTTAPAFNAGIALVSKPPRRR